MAKRTGTSIEMEERTEPGKDPPDPNSETIPPKPNKPKMTRTSMFNIFNNDNENTVQCEEIDLPNSNNSSMSLPDIENIQSYKTIGIAEENSNATTMYPDGAAKFPDGATNYPPGKTKILHPRSNESTPEKNIDRKQSKMSAIRDIIDPNKIIDNAKKTLQFRRTSTPTATELELDSQNETEMSIASVRSPSISYRDGFDDSNDEQMLASMIESPDKTLTQSNVTPSPIPSSGVTIDLTLPTTPTRRTNERNVTDNIITLNDDQGNPSGQTAQEDTPPAYDPNAHIPNHIIQSLIQNMASRQNEEILRLELQCKQLGEQCQNDIQQLLKLFSKNQATIDTVPTIERKVRATESTILQVQKDQEELIIRSRAAEENINTLLKVTETDKHEFSSKMVLVQNVVQGAIENINSSYEELTKASNDKINAQNQNLQKRNEAIRKNTENIIIHQESLDKHQELMNEAKERNAINKTNIDILTGQIRGNEHTSNKEIHDVRKDISNLHIKQNQIEVELKKANTEISARENSTNNTVRTPDTAQNYDALYNQIKSLNDQTTANNGEITMLEQRISRFTNEVQETTRENVTLCANARGQINSNIEGVKGELIRLGANQEKNTQEILKNKADQDNIVTNLNEIRGRTLEPGEISEQTTENVMNKQIKERTDEQTKMLIRERVKAITSTISINLARITRRDGIYNFRELLRRCLIISRTVQSTGDSILAM